MPFAHLSLRCPSSNPQVLQELRIVGSCIAFYALHLMSERANSYLKEKVRLVAVKLSFWDQKKNVMVVKNVGSGSLSLNLFLTLIALKHWGMTSSLRACLFPCKMEIIVPSYKIVR